MLAAQRAVGCEGKCKALLRRCATAHTTCVCVCVCVCARARVRVCVHTLPTLALADNTRATSVRNSCCLGRVSRWKIALARQVSVSFVVGLPANVRACCAYQAAGWRQRELALYPFVGEGREVRLKPPLGEGHRQLLLGTSAGGRFSSEIKGDRGEEDSVTP